MRCVKRPSGRVGGDTTAGRGEQTGRTHVGVGDVGEFEGGLWTRARGGKEDMDAVAKKKRGSEEWKCSKVMRDVKMIGVWVDVHITC